MREWLSCFDAFTSTTPTHANVHAKIRRTFFTPDIAH
jgi:hypothetical protein